MTRISIHGDTPISRYVTVTSAAQCRGFLAKLNSIARKLRERVRTPYHSAKLVAGPAEAAGGRVECTYEITYWSRQQIAEWQRKLAEEEG